MRRTADEVDRTYEELYPFLHRGQLLDGSEIHPQYARFWEAASADRF